MVGGNAGAASMSAPAAIRTAADSLTMTENVQFFWSGHNGTTTVGTARAGTGAICTYSPGLVGAAAMAGILGAGDTPVRRTRVVAAVMPAERSLVAVAALKLSLVAAAALKRSLVAVRAVERLLIAAAAAVVAAARAAVVAAARAAVAAAVVAARATEKSDAL